MHKPSLWAGLAAVFLLSLITAVRLLGDRLYHYPANPSPAALPSDSAIICLAGGKFRVEAAFALYSAGVGERLLIVGAGKKSTPQGLARAHAQEKAVEISEDRFRNVQVETESRNTIENAFAVGRYLQQNPEIRNVVLITSGYHMRRAQLMLEQQIHRQINVIPYTPPNEILGVTNWWHTWLGIQVTVTEYLKYVLAYLVVPQLGSF